MIKKCKQYCDQCDGSSSCISCIEGYYLNGNTCLPCNINCRTCYGPSDQECSICSDPNKYISPSQNNNCVSSCDQTQRYFINNTINPQQKYCLLCSDFCSACNLTSCTQCISSLYYLTSGGTCQPCHNSCSTCNGSTENDCLVCRDSTQFISQKQNNLCVPQCDLTQAQYVDTSNPNQKYCNKCNSLCQTCSDSIKCTTCIAGFYINPDGTCSPCHNSCSQCNGPSNNNCIVCQDSTQLGNICSSTCDITQSFYIDTSNPLQKYCRMCSNSLCQTCTDSSNNCNSCVLKYYLVGNTCSPCHNSCQQCSGPLENNCLVCQDSSQYISTRLNNICSSTCDLTQAQYVDQSNLLQKYCRECQQFCKTCSNRNFCDSCIDKYYLDLNSQCQPCDSTCQSLSQEVVVCSTQKQKNEEQGQQSIYQQVQEINYNRDDFCIKDQNNSQTHSSQFECKIQAAFQKPQMQNHVFSQILKQNDQNVGLKKRKRQKFKMMQTTLNCLDDFINDDLNSNKKNNVNPKGKMYSQMNLFQQNNLQNNIKSKDICIQSTNQTIKKIKQDSEDKNDIKPLKKNSSEKNDL
ncbi:hypothetical protein ABPG73_007803, partial [Tetrahymena malaccensis]